MANTDLSYYSEDPYIAGNFLVQWVECHDSGTYQGYMVEGMTDDAGEVIVCSTDGMPYGQVSCILTLDTDTACTNGDVIPIMLKGQGTLVWAKHDATNQTLLRGLPMSRSNSVAGATEIFVYADGTSEVISYIGFSNQYVLTDTTAIWYQLVMV